MNLFSGQCRTGFAASLSTCEIHRTGRSLADGVGRRVTASHARTIAELSFAVELAGDRDCTAAARVLVDGASD
jgi:hypothetical protein